MWRQLYQLINEEEAPTMIEYGLLIALIALAVITGAALFGMGASALFEVPPHYFQ